MNGPVRPVIVLGACLSLGLLAGSAARSRFSTVEVVDRVDIAAVVGDAVGMAVGPATGVPVLRVFGDYECPACAALERAAGDTLRALGRSGRLRFVYHHAPLRGHRRGPAAAAVALCVEETGPVWAAHAALYGSAPDWGTGPGGTGRLVASISSLVGDTVSIRECLLSKAVLERVAADRALADKLGIAEVPTVFWGDQRLRIRSWKGLVRFIRRRTPAP